MSASTADSGKPAKPAKSAKLDKSEAADALSVRLSVRGWLAIGFTLILLTSVLPRLWVRWEKFPPLVGYRIPYRASQDYWRFRRLTEVGKKNMAIPILGDSVVWGEFVRPDQTLSTMLNRQLAAPRFTNAGINGMHPLALSGLVRAHGRAIRGQRVLLHANLLWLSSPDRDLSGEEEVDFNHEELVPQFTLKIPSYQASQAERLRRLIHQNSRWFTWASHLRSRFDDQDLHHWTMDHPYQNPLNELQVEMELPQTELRHRAISWPERGIRVTEFDWVSDDIRQSLQWKGLLRTIDLLRGQYNRVFVVIGPLNPHMLGPASRERLEMLRRQAGSQLRSLGVPYATPAFLPTNLYADASHPLAEGYRRLAEMLLADVQFMAWLGD